MTRQGFAIFALVFMFLLMAGGLALMFFAGSIGLGVGRYFIWPNGYMSDYDQYSMVAGTTATSCQTGGRALAFIGGAGLICSGIALYFTLPDRSVPSNLGKPPPDKPKPSGPEGKKEKQAQNGG